MKARVTLIEGVRFAAEAGSGHSVVMDGAEEHGGRNTGFRPMEMLLVGLGGCTAFDVVSILRKGRQPVTDVVVDIEAERADTDPKIFTHIHMTYTVTGDGLDARKVERAVALSAEKYCSATAILEQSATITHEIRQAGGA